MRVLTSKGWCRGFLPYAAIDDGVRLRVRRWLTVTPVDQAYFVRPRDPRMVLNYLREVGLREVWRKIRSRRAETLRNDKYLSVGVGVADDDEQEAFVFVATSHPRGLDEIVLPRAAVRRVERSPADSELLQHAAYDGEAPEALQPLVGWSAFSGVKVEEVAWARALDCAEALLQVERSWESIPAVDPAGPATGAATGPATAPTGRRRAALFGYGNYAKLYVVPNVGDGTALVRVHEVDPTQIPRPPQPFGWSTSPEPEPGANYDVYYIAGYHHTHAPLAAHALRQNAVAVVEKPVVVDEAQLGDIVAALSSQSGRLFACFHKRYSALNDLALADLGARQGAPIDYHAIVYEVPLPARHWYRWPNSHSRIVSNGCHWIDHFLFLNGYSPPVEIDLFADRHGTINCSAALENGAMFSMVLTERGSERLGVRDHVQLRAGDVTVTIDDSSRYMAEDSRRIIRRARVNKADAYRRMYRTIAAAIEADRPGDSIASVEIGSRLMLAYERELGLRFPGLVVGG